MAALVDRILFGRRYLRLFSTWRERARYFRCRHGRTGAAPIQLWVRDLAVPVYCRPGTTDAATLWGVFGETFHLPHKDLGSAPVILDLGANVGYTMVDFALRYPNARVIGVELDRGNVSIAARNIEPFGNRCALVHAAVWIQDGWVRYEGREEWGYRVSATLDANADAGGHGFGTAPSRTVASILDDLDIDHVAFLKMDIEGAETNVIGSGAQWLKRVSMLSVEAHSSDALGQCQRALEDAGFNVVRHPRHGGGLLADRLGASSPRWPAPTQR